MMMALGDVHIRFIMLVMIRQAAGKGWSIGVQRMHSLHYELIDDYLRMNGL